jgi:hypothetical protein
MSQLKEQIQFIKYNLNYYNNLYNDLSSLTEFEDITNGRKGAVLINLKNDLIPLVRTTTNYNKPNQQFTNIHYNIIENIQKVSKIKNLELNNALIEIYDNLYKKMGYHSDQALDLAENSYICLYSCYSNQNTKNIRKLKIKNKLTNECSEVLLEHNTVVIFSTNTNKNYIHKIVLELKTNDNVNWLGITFRLSKTYIKFINEIPYFHSNKQILKLANDNEKKEFSKHKRSENDNIDYEYPEINYTISIGDTLIPL